MHGGRSRGALQRPVDDLDGILFGFFRFRLHPGFVQLNHIGAGGEQIADFFIDRRGKIHGTGLIVAIMFVNRGLGHGEGAGQGDFDQAVGVGAQEFNITNFDRAGAADRSRDAGHDVGFAGPARHFGGIVQIDAAERRREPVGIAFPSYFPVGDDIDPGTLHVVNGRQGRRVLGVLKLIRRDLPYFAGPDPGRHHGFQHGTVHQPVGLHIASDNCRWQQVVFMGHFSFRQGIAALCGH